jgi:hypothetical protein
MKTHIYRLLSIVTLAGAGVFHCSMDGMAGGGGSDVGNGRVVGKMVINQGDPAGNTQVMLIPGNYNPGTDGPLSDSLIDTTNSGGEYGFNMLNEGIYNIFAVQLDSRERLFIGSIIVRRNATTNVPVDTLQQSGTIKVMLPDSVDAVNGYVYVPGTTITADLGGDTGFIIVDSVPAGTMPAVNYSTVGGSIPVVLRYNMQVVSGDTVTLAYPTWKYSKRLYLNTTATGAGVSGDVRGFPVLVRLTNSNFVFNQAQIYGEDIRFAKSDYTPLSYEIERWDSANQKAEVWVNVDTVLGGNNAQYLEIYWGKSNVGSGSDAAAVFDTANGFAGVWHMNETPAGAASIRDRTHNAFNGTPTGMNASAGVEGIVGRCLDFDGSNDYIMLPTIATDFTQGFTVCGWMKYVAFNNYSRLIDFGVDGDNNNNIVFANKYMSDTLRWTIWSDTTQETPLDVPNYFVLDEWIYVAGTYDGSTMRAYKDGTLVGSLGNPGGLKPAVRARSYIARSNWPADRLYNGLVDELQVSKTARSVDWITLSYMNQKASDALVVFGQ